MKVYLAKSISNLPMYGDVPDLTQNNDSVETVEISEAECEFIDKLFVDQTNNLCGTALDIGDYQYYNTDMCKLLLEWVIRERDSDCMIPIKNFLNTLEDYLRSAISNNTGIAIEL